MIHSWTYSLSSCAAVDMAQTDEHLTLPLLHQPKEKLLLCIEGQFPYAIGLNQ